MRIRAQVDTNGNMLTTPSMTKIAEVVDRLRAIPAADKVTLTIDIDGPADALALLSPALAAAVSAAFVIKPA